MDKNLWCPYWINNAELCKSGDSGIQNCPRVAACLENFYIPEIQYATCPNEGCIFNRNLEPPPDGSVAVYDRTQGGFFEGDICTYIIENPSTSDFNDVMNLRIEMFWHCFPVLIKGTSVN